MKRKSRIVSKQECPLCHQAIGATAFNRHTNTCFGRGLKANRSIKGIHTLPKHETPLTCRYCESLRKNKISLAQHERVCAFNPGRTYNNGMTGKEAWNKGSNASKDERIAKYASTNKERYNSGINTHPMLGKHLSMEHRNKLSERMSLNNKGGRCLWYTVAGQKVQGTWEKRLAEKMQALGLNWRKLVLNKDTFVYNQEGKIRHYTPDFECEGHLIEVKGYWRDVDREKMKYVFNDHPDLTLNIVEKVKFEMLLASNSFTEFLTILKS
jgi:hypothetical protein